MKRFALAVLAVLVWSGPVLRADVLWDQPWDGVSRGSPAQDFTDTDYRIYSVWLFDDFAVREPGWWIDRVTGVRQRTGRYAIQSRRLSFHLARAARGRAGCGRRRQ